MSETIKTLHQLKQMRSRAVSELTTKLAKQNQLCQRYQQNIQALTSLSKEITPTSGVSAALMSNGSNYKSHIQRVINWQKQEYALANKTAQGMQQDLVTQARKEKTLDVVLSDRLAEQKLTLERKQQKITDGLSTQAWLRSQAAG